MERALKKRVWKVRGKCLKHKDHEPVIRETVKLVGRIEAPLEINVQVFKLSMTVRLCDVSSNFQYLAAKWRK